MTKTFGAGGFKKSSRSRKLGSSSECKRLPGDDDNDDEKAIGEETEDVEGREEDRG